MLYLILFLFFVIPEVAIVVFIVNLCLYLSAKTQNRQQPDSVSAKKMKLYMIMMIVSSIIAIVLVAVIITFIVVLFNSMSFM